MHAVIGGNAIDLAIKFKTRTGDTVGDPADGRAEILPLRDIFRNIGIARCNVRKVTIGVGHTDRLDSSAVTDDPDRHAGSIGKRHRVDSFTAGQRSKNVAL